MDSNVQPDRISNLPDVLLVTIISFLSFKDCIKTSKLSQRWRYLYRETRKVAFKESDFVSPSVYGQPILYSRAMTAFVDNVRRWVSRVSDYAIDSMEICISDPETYLDQIQSLIADAVQKRVKNMVLDFSHPDWRTYDDVEHLVFVVEVPEGVYNLTTLESLRVCACKNFDPSRFSNPEKFKSLSFGWMRLTKLEPLLSKSSKLVSLSINGCWDLDFTTIAGNMREFSFENSDLSLSCTFDMPRANIFRYSGEIFSLGFERVDTIIRDIYLDFGVMGEYDESNYLTCVEGIVLCDLLNHLPSSITLTVCNYLLQVIQIVPHPHLLGRVKTQNLVLKTRFHPNEFTGIWLLLTNCPNLETLTFDMLPSSSSVTARPIDPPKYWMHNIIFSYMRKTLKVVVVKNFVGGPELHVINNLIRSRRDEHDLVLEIVELHVSYGLNKNQKKYANAQAKMLQGNSKHVKIRVHNSLDK